ncbi:MAG: Na/Pi cotransporter family protein [Lachnospiraceae bacterium]|nr:Na/Pi cotransporter family protein [Lachnospiraceae bacterium]
MSTADVVTSFLNLLAGIGVFLVACSMMSSNLEALSSVKLRSLFSKAAKSKLVGVGIGTVGTAAIQSSGATTVMVIGFVNAGIMTLEQAATIIYGANIGTTVTGQLVAFGMSGGGGVSTTIIFSAFAGVGGFISIFAKKDVIKHVGGILSGFGMLFAALSMMSGAMNSFAKLDSVKEFLASIDNVILLILIGALLTAIVQSSSVMTSVAITMVVAGLITLNQGIYLTMGSNIGSCVVALIAGLSSSKSAKRTSIVHLLFNVGGVVVFAILGVVLELVSGGSLGYGSIFGKMFTESPQIQLAMFHTVFNLTTVIIMLPLTKQLIKLVMKIIPETADDKNKEEFKLHYVDENMIKTPPIMVAQVKNEIVNMSKLAMKNFNSSLKIICDLDFSKEKEFADTEREIDFINKKLVEMVVKLSRTPLSEADYKYVTTTFHTISDIERIGDYAENIVEYAQILKNEGRGFSQSALTETAYVQEKVNYLYDKVMDAYINHNKASFDEASDIENEIDRITERMEQNHIIRLNEGICTAVVGAQYMSLASNAERIADHIFNIGKMAQMNKRV